METISQLKSYCWPKTLNYLFCIQEKGGGNGTTAGNVSPVEVRTEEEGTYGVWFVSPVCGSEAEKYRQAGRPRAALDTGGQTPFSEYRTGWSWGQVPGYGGREGLQLLGAGGRQPRERILQMEAEGEMIQGSLSPGGLFTDWPHSVFYRGQNDSQHHAQPLVENNPPMLGTSNDLKKGTASPTAGKVCCFSNFAQVVLVCVAGTLSIWSRPTLRHLPPESAGPWGQLPGKEGSLTFLLGG